jgi:decaprenyl-phosphate phosphoribosyltransferase
VWRHVIVFDIFAVAGGFVLRAVAGGVAAPVNLSRWFLLVVISSAVFVAAAKRYAELRRTDGVHDRHRRVLDYYSPRALELIIAGAIAVALLAYCMWAFSVPTVRGIPWRPMTILPFAACLLRYNELVHRGTGEAPEDVLLSDRPLQLAGLAWLVLFALEVHAAS